MLVSMNSNIQLFINYFYCHYHLGATWLSFLFILFILPGSVVKVVIKGHLILVCRQDWVNLGHHSCRKSSELSIWPQLVTVGISVITLPKKTLPTSTCYLSVSKRLGFIPLNMYALLSLTSKPIIMRWDHVQALSCQLNKKRFKTCERDQREIMEATLTP